MGFHKARWSNNYLNFIKTKNFFHVVYLHVNIFIKKKSRQRFFRINIPNIRNVRAICYLPRIE